MTTRFIPSVPLDLTEEDLVGILRDLVHKTPASIWIRGLDGKILFANQTIRNGAPEFGEIVGRYSHELLNAEDEAKIAAKAQEALLTGDRVVFEHSFTSQDWNRTYQLCLSPAFGVCGLPVGVAGYGVDLTELRRLETKLDEEQVALGLALVSAHAGVGVVDLPSGRVTYSEEYVELFGVPSRNSTMESWQDRIHPDDRAGVLQKLDDAIRTGANIDLTYRYPLSDGSNQWTNTRGKVYYSAEGSPEKLVAICLDVSDRIERERERERYEKRFEAFMGQLPAHAWIVDHQGMITYANPNFQSLFGKEITGAPIASLLDRRAAETHRVRNEIVLSTSKPLRTQESLPDRWGGVGTFLITRFPLFDTADSPVSVGAYAIDITEMVLAREELIRLNNELEERVSERTQRLEQANNELGAFAHGVAHDLRGPLRSLNYYAHAILEELSDQLAPHQIEMLRHQANTTTRLGAMIDSLLKLAESERTEMVRQPVALGELIRNLWRDLRGEPAALVIKQEGTISADAALLSSVFQNLLDNAEKYRHPDRPLRIEFGWSDAQQAWYLSDNGIGIASQDTERIFEPFLRLANTESQQGNGIGLTQVRRIIERHRGRIHAESELGKGTTFWFTVPDERGRI